MAAAAGNSISARSVLALELGGGAFGTNILSTEELLRQADDAEALAKLVSYGPDKAVLRERAIRLRQQASALAEQRSWVHSVDKAQDE